MSLGEPHAELDKSGKGRYFGYVDEHQMIERVLFAGFPRQSVTTTMLGFSICSLTSGCTVYDIVISQGFMKKIKEKEIFMSFFMTVCVRCLSLFLQGHQPETSDSVKLFLKDGLK